jgi:site-specific DNA-methyltransferase (adenine-specific)
MAVIALIPSRTDTLWWQELVRPTAQAVCYWKGRIHFIGAKHGAPFPSALIYWGREAGRFKAVFCKHGTVDILRTAPRPPRRHLSVAA